jgi:very-short-patch-repair endonuclease
VVVVEYDGIHHWADGRQRAWDIERIALLEAVGWVVIRVSAEMLARPHAVVERVAAALVSRGCRQTW